MESRVGIRMNKPYLARIRVYPIKSLDPLDLQRVRVVAGAGLAGDREFALFDDGGNILNAKRLGMSILGVRARYDHAGRSVELHAEGNRLQSHLVEGRTEMEVFLGDVLGTRVRVRQDTRVGYFDDMEATGPTVVGSASIDTVAGWFGLAPDEIRRRFRANLEIAGLEPFEEDLLFGKPGQPRRFRIGDVEFLGTNPCSRCIVPTLDSRGGPPQSDLTAVRFSERRKRHVWPHSKIESYGHYYRFCVNTLLAPGQGPKSLAVGDAFLPPEQGATAVSNRR